VSLFQRCPHFRVLGADRKAFWGQKGCPHLAACPSFTRTHVTGFTAHNTSLFCSIDDHNITLTNPGFKPPTFRSLAPCANHSSTYTLRRHQLFICIPTPQHLPLNIEDGGELDPVLKTKSLIVILICTAKIAGNVNCFCSVLETWRLFFIPGTVKELIL
jgi:hypothetical protein